MDWLEIISENFLFEGTRSQYYLDQFLERYPIIAHGVGLSIGSADALDWDYLARLKKLIHKLDPPWVSDHLCWGHVKGQHFHNLMPLPYTAETARYVAGRIAIVQDYLEKPFIIENVSSYAEFKSSEMTEWDFVAQILDQADCGMLFDVNNVYVSAVNHEFSPDTYLNAIDPSRVYQFHLAGHRRKENFILDSHDSPVCRDVWDLYAKAVARFGDVSLMIERDDDIPPLSELLIELNEAKTIHHETRTKTASRA